jgi:alcohol dehydrogenase (cytochrome c)
VIPGKEPTVEGNLVYPSLQGATNWFSPSYSPKSGLFFVSVREMGSIYYKSDVEFEEGKPFMGGGERALSGDQAHGAVRALNAETGEMNWEFKLQSPPWSGLMSTAGGLVFGGSMEGNFFALDAGTGNPLWEIQTGGPIIANPIGFNIDGDQHVAIAAGHSIYVFGL